MTMLLLMTGCVAAKSECPGWANKKWILDSGWEERLTRNEKVQVASHNEDVEDFCR